MKILAFDTSTKYLSIACLEDEEPKAEFHEPSGVRHGEILVPTIKGMLEGLGWGMPDIGLICMGLGPGSFTGLRIAAATVKGFAAVLGCKVIGVPTMDVIVSGLPGRPRGRVAPLLDAHKGKVYTCVYDCSQDGTERLTEYLLIKLEDLLSGLEKETCFFGGAIEKYKETLDRCPLAKYDENILWYPRAAETGRIGYKRSLVRTDDPADLEPLYLHAKDCNTTRPDVADTV
ncbi:MAG: tRNA (adenosine(37)-N6)-threonylcarbamoyltransferase complex dimerization subunit type 1 TsaB [Candidatus Omnitrophota bacterium]